MLASWNEFELVNVSSYLIFWRNFCRIGVISFRVWWNSVVKPSEPGVCLIGRFLTINSVCLTDRGLLRLSVSSWVSFGRLCLIRNLFYIWVVELIGIKLFTIFPYYPFNICKVCSDVTFFILYMLLVCIFFLFPIIYMVGG